MAWTPDTTRRGFLHRRRRPARHQSAIEGLVDRSQWRTGRCTVVHFNRRSRIDRADERSSGISRSAAHRVSEQRETATSSRRHTCSQLRAWRRKLAPGDMGKFIANLDTHIRECFDCTILIPHHVGVMDSGRARGSSALRAAVDTEIICDRTDRTVIVKCTKSKDAVGVPNCSRVRSRTSSSCPGAIEGRSARIRPSSCTRSSSDALSVGKDRGGWEAIERKAFDMLLVAV